MATGFVNINGILKGSLAPKVPWEQPILTKNGTPFTDPLALLPSSQSFYEQAQAWNSFSSQATEFDKGWSPTGMPATLDMVTIDKINVNKFTFKNRNHNADIVHPMKNFKLYVSNDRKEFIEIYSGTNPNTGSLEEFSVDLSYVGYYNYFRLEILNSYNNYVAVGQITLTATVIDSNYVPYSSQALMNLGIEPESTYEERQTQMNEIGVI